MIDLKELNKVVCDLFRQALEAAGSSAEILPELVAEDVPSPIIRPSAKVQLEDGAQARLLASGQEKTVTFRLYFFAADRYRPKLENLAVRQAVGEAFLDGLTVGDTYLGIDEGVRFTVADGVLVATIDLSWSEDIPEPDGEPMENLNYNEEVSI